MAYRTPPLGWLAGWLATLPTPPPLASIRLDIEFSLRDKEGMNDKLLQISVGSLRLMQWLSKIHCCKFCKSNALKYVSFSHGMEWHDMAWCMIHCTTESRASTHSWVSTNVLNLQCTECNKTL